MENSFHGSIAEIPGVAVDNFTGNNINSRAFFLSHGHKDHFSGIDDSIFLKKLEKSDEIFIYMTELTWCILKKMTYLCICKLFEKYLKIIKLGTETVKLPAKGKWSEEYLTVTTIPAGHCPGSVMFLFQTRLDQLILYTGDFRIAESDVAKFRQLHDKNRKPLEIDTLYVDTTFCSEEYEHFPKRSDCIKELSSKITNWLSQNEKNRIFLSLSATFGYEFIFLELYQHTKQKVLVDSARLEVYKKIPKLLNAVTTTISEASLHLQKHPFDFNYLKIRLSAMSWRKYRPGTSTVRTVGDKSLEVCFPTHCSRSEVLNFIAYLSPKHCVGFPKSIDYLNDVQMPDNIENNMFLRDRRCKRKNCDKKNNDELKKMFHL